MGVITALLVLEIARVVVAAVKAEVLAREPFVVVGNGQHFVEKFRDRVMRKCATFVKSMY